MITGFDERHLVDVLEALYSLERTADEWLMQVLVALSRVCGGDLDPAGLFYDASDVGNLKIYGRRNLGNAPPELVGQWKVFESLVNPAFVRATFRSLLVGNGRKSAYQYVGPVVAEREKHGHGDFFYVNALDPSGIGCVVSFNCRRPDFALDAKSLNLLRRIASHLGAAYRLGRRLGFHTGMLPAATDGASADLPIAEAILDDGGRIVHAEGVARTKGAQEEIRDAAARIEAARTLSQRQRGMDAIDAWHPLTRARWTLVDTFERGGQRYVLARENQANGADLSVLTDRERQVVVHAGFGMTTREIGYALGISDKTVRVLLARAARRLSVRGRKELLARTSPHGSQTAITGKRGNERSA